MPGSGKPWYMQPQPWAQALPSRRVAPDAREQTWSKEISDCGMRIRHRHEDNARNNSKGLEVHRVAINRTEEAVGRAIAAGDLEEQVHAREVKAEGVGIYVQTLERYVELVNDDLNELLKWNTCETMQLGEETEDIKQHISSLVSNVAALKQRVDLKDRLDNHELGKVHLIKERTKALEDKIELLAMNPSGASVDVHEGILILASSVQAVEKEVNGLIVDFAEKVQNFESKVDDLTAALSEKNIKIQTLETKHGVLEETMDRVFDELHKLNGKNQLVEYRCHLLNDRLHNMARRETAYKARKARKDQVTQAKIASLEDRLLNAERKLALSAAADDRREEETKRGDDEEDSDDEKSSGKKRSLDSKSDSSSTLVASPSSASSPQTPDTTTYLHQTHTDLNHHLLSYHRKAHIIIETGNPIIAWSRTSDPHEIRWRQIHTVKATLDQLLQRSRDIWRECGACDEVVYISPASSKKEVYLSTSLDELVARIKAGESEGSRVVEEVQAFSARWQGHVLGAGDDQKTIDERRKEGALDPGRAARYMVDGVCRRGG